MSGITELEPPATDLITLTRHILSQQHELGERASGDLTLLLVAIQVSAFLCLCEVHRQGSQDRSKGGCRMMHWEVRHDGRQMVGTRNACCSGKAPWCEANEVGMERQHRPPLRAEHWLVKMQAALLRSSRSTGRPEGKRGTCTGLEGFTIENSLSSTNPQVTSKYIASNVRKARLINLVGLAGEQNVQGEDQKKLDVLSNDIMVNALRASGKCSVMVSEEVDDAIVVTGSKGT